MDTEVATNKVLQTTDYAKFKLLSPNREVNEGHVNKLKRSIENDGSWLDKHPVLVNENFDIIDGQHRFTACKELGLPISYTVVEGLNVNDARNMNANHRNWTLGDYAASYAETDPNYQRYVKLVEDYGFSHGITLFLATGGEKKGLFAEFRNGEFSLTEEDVAKAKPDFENLSELSEYTDAAFRKPFASAFIKASRAPDFDLDRLLNKVRQFRSTVKAYPSVVDNLRELEELYNHGQGDSSRTRLF